MRNIIVIGASAGGIPAIKSVLGGLGGQMDAAFFIVQHLSRDSSAQNIIEIFQRHTSLVCEVASDGMPFQAGHLYLAPPDHHLILEEEHMRVTSGAYENKHRPSVDALFRSAAVAYGNRVIGIVLTGTLEDGTSGMSAIKRCGGTCIVQDPSLAQFYSMPQSVLNNVPVDYKAPLEEIPLRIREVLNAPLPLEVAIPDELRIEADITKRMMSNIDEMKSIAERSDFVCPDCGGGLWAVKNDPAHRYRCHTGHTYTAKLLEKLQREKLEESLWVSIRMLEERSNLYKVMAGRYSNAGHSSGHLQRIEDTEHHINRLKKLLQDLGSQGL
ncbi:chemotaxis protein CheB [Flavobacterium sp. 1355]|jgi:two-component system, chemotaxis family, protein-glutamate methylesterase/glutaminase|uniref:chemotaxis protein CheB n=1 Tax=Flavobacterium sp. 1355 TaxID=2806571 RepID=UPI001AE9E25F|nr:chemotaxis protein CheB [Flavobacterium sp. 1355]MBP1223091.1 two-component system chemotaxis response regulator CheB [Flavobacterium sp. 1355]